ncbi:MAG: SRPBCC family protein [Betaproteobacteria bacterium]|nr:SRPBCC family protein [Betaproteobacteria bacterium]
MLKTILIVIALVFVALIGFAMTKPDDFKIERKANIKAPPEKVFAFLNDFKQWGAWSPWEKKDPNMKRNFGANTSGKGATYAWDGNKDVGQGSMEVMESTPPSRLAIKLNFVKPFEASNAVDFTLTPAGGGTEVTWAMEGKNNFMSKLMQVFMSMDKMVGPDFETGLANLKAAAEKS